MTISVKTNTELHLARKDRTTGSWLAMKFQNYHLTNGNFGDDLNPGEARPVS